MSFAIRKENTKQSENVKSIKRLLLLLAKSLKISFFKSPREYRRGSSPVIGENGKRNHESHQGGKTRFVFDLFRAIHTEASKKVNSIDSWEEICVYDLKLKKIAIS